MQDRLSANINYGPHLIRRDLTAVGLRAYEPVVFGLRFALHSQKCQPFISTETEQSVFQLEF